VNTLVRRDADRRADLQQPDATRTGSFRASDYLEGTIDRNAGQPCRSPCATFTDAASGGSGVCDARTPYAGEAELLPRSRYP
jgi:hypothetical protein